MASASTPSANEPAKDLILVHTVQLKPLKKSQILERITSSCISDVVTASVNSEKTCLKKLMNIISIIMKNHKKRLFSWATEIDFRYETKARKVMVDFKFDALYR